MLTPIAFMETFSTLTTMWPHRAPTQETVEQLAVLYLEALSDLTDGDFRTAARLARRSCIHFPTPGELRNLICRSGEDGGPTNADLYAVQARHQEIEGGPRLLSGPTPDPERVRRMIADLLAEQKRREERVRADDYWRPRSGDTGSDRAKRLAEYPGKAAADAILDGLRFGGPTPPPGVRRLDSRLDLTGKAAEMLRDKPERSAAQAPGRMREAAGRGTTT